MTSTKSTNDRFLKIEKRLSKLEKAVFTSPTSTKKGTQKYKGLSGGIQLIIDNGFFKKQREVKEVISELKREGYHYSNESIAKILSRDFAHTKRILTRVKSGRNYKYAIRK